jgi:hypothetical protein
MLDSVYRSNKYSFRHHILMTVLFAGYKRNKMQ